MLVLRKRVRSIADEVRKGIAKEIGVDVLDVPLSYIEEAVYNIVEAHNSVFINKSRLITSGRIIGKIIKKLHGFEVKGGKKEEEESEIEKILEEVEHEEMGEMETHHEARSR